jgi:ATP-dependent Clp protease ATP-binding subunit ClpX
MLSPIAIARELERHGYKGQEEQRRSLALMAYRHIRRLKRLHVYGERRKDVPPKQNLLMLGPTGCGKTFLVELLFQHIFKLPTVIIDITNFTESGYVGDDARTILTRLIEASGDDPFLAACGVVCLDEFDKVASADSSARFSGQGTTKDVSGYGVQRELLKMIEGAEVNAPMDYGFSGYGPRSLISTRDIPFIACGAFSGIEELNGNSRPRAGFVGTEKNESPEVGLEEVLLFQKYGFLPELIGRFSRIVRFSPLTEDILRRILRENILPQFENEFRWEGLDLNVTESALDHIITRSQKRGTGARGLHAELVSAVERAAFATFMRVTNMEVVITFAEGKLKSIVRKPEKKKLKILKTRLGRGDDNPMISKKKVI